jgi:hypothetical protein
MDLVFAKRVKEIIDEYKITTWFETGVDVGTTALTVTKMVEKWVGVEIRETSSRDSRNFVNLITLRCEGHSISATLTGRNGEPRLVMIDDHATECRLHRHASRATDQVLLSSS